MKRLITAFILAIAIAAASATGHAADADTASRIIAERISSDDFVLLDVRTPGEYKGARIENARLLNFYAPDFRESLAGMDRDKEYLVYCATGGRSSAAVALMRKLGFTRIIHLDGGIMSWAREGFPVVRGP